MAEEIITVSAKLNDDLSSLLHIMFEHMEHEEAFCYLEDKLREAIQEKGNELLQDV